MLCYEEQKKRNVRVTQSSRIGAKGINLVVGLVLKKECKLNLVQVCAEIQGIPKKIGHYVKSLDSSYTPMGKYYDCC